ncbi:hypothetical protein [Paenibacillus roseipurpureus]|uniref:Uncharacterized protein n=1 Tax=Paenibacillus roseopurpureus TaxID=2918901 RepID=A0AA96LLX0_9BACL|nr:hypothetical protein [Paenibacillus sp. MBLB1832]WNR43001.1 hypothetical protein MJB10_18005 [Paenibacillus sp. MBLB1832]
MEKSQLEELTKEFQKIPITSLQELSKAIFNNGIICYIQEIENKINSISSDDLKLKWLDIKRHITLEDTAYLDDFPDGYFYFADLWSNDSGELLLILKKHH